jgi:hypothetical protein
MLLQSLRALCKAAGGVGSIWEQLEAVVRATGVSGRYVYGFWTELHFADHDMLTANNKCMINSTKLLTIQPPLEHGYGECQQSSDDLGLVSWVIGNLFVHSYTYPAGG